MKQKLIQLAADRTRFLTDAENALKENSQEAYEAAMGKVRDLNEEIDRIQNLMREQERAIADKPMSVPEARDMAAERGNDLMQGRAVKFSVRDVRQMLRGAGQVMDATTLATGTLVQPTGTGTNLRDPIGSRPSSIVDQVYVQDLIGVGTWLEPFVKTESDAQGGKVSTTAGTARTASADPTFGYAKISPYELSVTSFVDRNISRLTPVNYYAKVYGMAMKALRKALANLIVNGDGQASPDFYGIKTAKDSAGNAMYATVDVAGISESLLDDLFFSYGGDDEVGGGAGLYLSKTDLKAIGKLRNGDKERVFKVHPDAANPNIGTIEDGGTFIPYCIHSGLTALSETTAGAAAVQTMLYGDPMYFFLGLFGEYSIRVDESIKGVERMFTILGDAMVGGNLVVPNGMSIATVPKTN